MEAGFREVSNYTAMPYCSFASASATSTTVAAIDDWRAGAGTSSTTTDRCEPWRRTAGGESGSLVVEDLRASGSVCAVGARIVIRGGGSGLPAASGGGEEGGVVEDLLFVVRRAYQCSGGKPGGVVLPE
jgi:hypothetical protein